MELAPDDLTLYPKRGKWIGVGLTGLVLGAGSLGMAISESIAKNPFRTQRHSWDEVTRFESYSVYTEYTNARIVAYGLTDREAAGPSLWRRLNRGLDKTLPDTYGYDARQLAGLMEGYRQRYSSSAGRPS
ncbi:MAG: hypothetical protein QOE11_2859 [Solirubrobacteraceae bacterium]|jgi:hypothetical protein|nr:hypothetical protein [Solirubrobacteraceae bacterium]